MSAKSNNLSSFYKVVWEAEDSGDGYATQWFTSLTKAKAFAYSLARECVKTAREKISPVYTYFMITRLQFPVGTKAGVLDALNGAHQGWLKIGDYLVEVETREVGDDYEISKSSILWKPAENHLYTD
jgi:hypothetical protein